MRCRVADFQGKLGPIIDRRIGKERGAETAVLANVLSGSGMAQMDGLGGLLPLASSLRSDLG